MLENQEIEEALLKNSVWGLDGILAINKQFPFFENHSVLKTQEVPEE